MKILHTSDWHLGRSLYGRKRYEEFTAFLDWLAQTIEEEKVDALLVAGDVFDTSTPSNRAQELYYRFLCRCFLQPKNDPSLQSKIDPPELKKIEDIELPFFPLPPCVRIVVT
jgi:DNA repair exonuclease SbcCD nuclease subunit